LSGGAASAPFELSLADSEVAGIAVDAQAAIVSFSAAAVRRGGEAGFVRSLQLRLEAPSEVQGSNGIGRIREGRLWIAGAPLSAPRLPLQAAGPARIELVFHNGVVFAAAAAWAALHFDADPGFVLSYAC
jgi:hypothetical protein